MSDTQILTELRRESPLVRFDLASSAVGAPTEEATVVAAERPYLGHLNLRGRPDDTRFRTAVERVLDLPLPLEPNTVVERTTLTVCWLGPDEWLLLCPGERERELVGNLRCALEGAFAAVTELSGGQTVIALEGGAVRDVLARGCTLDLHPRAFAPGRCAQTLLGKAPVLIRLVSETPRFELLVRRSFADYVWAYLVDAAWDETFLVVNELP